MTTDFLTLSAARAGPREGGLNMTQAPKNLQTIESHILDLQRLHPSASGDFTSLLNDISFAAKVISREVNKAGLVEDILGATGDENVQGEVVQKLDEYANNVFLRCLGTRGQVCIMGSEELADPVFADTERRAPATTSWSSIPWTAVRNIDANVSVGHHLRHLEAQARPGQGRPARTCCSRAANWWPPATSSTARAPCSSTPPATGSTASLSTRASASSCSATRTSRRPSAATIYSVNEAYEPTWSPRCARSCGSSSTAATPRGHRKDAPADGRRHDRALHRLAGGRFPPQPALRRASTSIRPTTDKPEGKLRLMCEAAPLAMIVENAGGYASDGHRSILDIVPDDLHQRVPLYIGSRDDVLWIEKMISQGRTASELGSNRQREKGGLRAALFSADSRRRSDLRVHLLLQALGLDHQAQGHVLAAGPVAACRPGSGWLHPAAPPPRWPSISTTREPSRM